MIVRVPGSSANLGPGFDCFGIAWQLYNDIEFIKEGKGLQISGCPEIFRSRENLAYQGYLAVINAAGISEHGLMINFLSTEIPVSRGLGSSAALITAGAVAANRLNGLDYSKQQLLSIVTPVEGHPDNIAPSLFGGFTVSTIDADRAVSASLPLSSTLHFTAIIPDFQLSTELSRSVLPCEYSRSDAVFNVSRASLLLMALANGDTELLRVGLQDRIHQPYRAKLIRGFEGVKKLAYSLGADGLCISGAGSTLLCISGDSKFSVRMREAMSEKFPAWRVISVQPDLNGAEVI